MAAEWIQVSLRAWAPGRAVGAEFLAALGVDPADGLRTELATGPGLAAHVYLVDEQLAAHTGAEEPSESFALAVETALLRAAVWLRHRHSGIFERCRADGIRADIFVGSWIDQDQFDLDLPPSFLLACGEAGLPLSIVTND